MRNVFEGYTSVEDEIMIQFAHYQMEELSCLALSKKTNNQKRYDKLLNRAKKYDNLQLELVLQFAEEVGCQLPIEMTMFLEKKFTKR